jgi:RHS repeat-associated protein
VPEYFAYHGGQVVMQFNDESDLTHRYLWNPAATDHLLADEAVTSLLTAGTILWPLADHLGTIRDLASHQVTPTHDTTINNHRIYDSFGNLTSESNTAIDLIFGFTGRQFDEDTELQYNLNRWYDAKAGRWISEDPIGFAAGDSNLQRYVRNSPTTRVDPTGLFGCTSNKPCSPSALNFKFDHHSTYTLDLSGPRFGDNYKTGDDNYRDMLRIEESIKRIYPHDNWFSSLSAYDARQITTRIAGRSAFLIGVKGNPKVNSDCTCDLSGVKVTLFPYQVIYKDEGPETINIAGEVLDGATTTKEHEDWHINGLPDALQSKVETALNGKRQTRSMGFIGMYYNEMSRIARELGLKNNPGQKRGQKECDALVYELKIEVGKSVPTITNAGEWHEKSTDPQADFNVIIK